MADFGISNGCLYPAIRNGTVLLLVFATAADTSVTLGLSALAIF